MNYKQAFYSKLEDCYLGVKIKDFHKGNITKSGFSNLLKIKEQYFAHIKAYLESQIENKPQSHDIYNKLFTFFDSYLSESGTPFFTDTPIYKNIYAKVYSNSKDTSLFYKTQNLYYVKSDTLYQSLTLSDEQESYEVIFDASEYKQNADNIKNKITFKLHSIQSSEESKPQILIKVSNQKDLFAELNNVFKQNSNEFSEEFLKNLKQNAILKDSKIKINEEELKKIFRSYKKQSEIDFFIHKNAKAFLQEQFDLWMFGYLYKESAIQEWNPDIIAHLQRIKNIAHEIIKLIADFENELKAIWLKPKFAKKVEYVFSVDIILQLVNNAKTLLGTIANDKGFESQIKEWQELNLVDESFDKQNFLDFCHFEVLRSKAEESINAPLCDVESDKLEESYSMDSYRDSSVSTKLQNDRDIYLCGNLLAPPSHFSNAQNDKEVACHSEALAEESRKDSNRDISHFSNTQNDKESDQYRYLPIDTKHFSQETKYQILSSFENLESLLNGELVKADNFQALNTLMPKYQGKVDLIYIDPPYNTGNDGFIYADNFNHASWLSMINNRIELARELLNLKGSMFISIDDKEQARLKLICDEVFGEENFVANFVWQGKYTTSNDAKYASNQNENIFCFSSNIDRFSFNLLARTESMDAAYKNPDNDPKGVWKATPLHAKSGSENNLYTITFPNGISWNAPKGRYPRYSKERLMEIYFENGLYFNKNGGIDKKTYLSEVKQGKTIGTFWSYQEVGSTHEGNEDLAFILDKGIFDNPKPEKLLQRILEIASKDSSIVLDFFAGSGTTLAVAQKLGRKWLGVEMGEHFYSVVIPRLKKVIAGFASGISKECDYKGGGAFRYYELESYEEALSHCEYVLQDSYYYESSPCHSEPALAGEESQNIKSQEMFRYAQHDKEVACHSEVLHSKAEESQNANLCHSEGDKPEESQQGNKTDISASPQHDKEIYKGKDYAKAESILDYRKSRKLIDKLSKGESVCLDMHTEYRKDFDIFQSMANLMGWKIKRLFLDSKGIESCEFDNGEILSLDSLDLAKYPKLKNLIWWE